MMIKMGWKRYKDSNYEVSSIGLVRIICHTVTKSNGVIYHCVPKILKPATDSKGYLRVALSINGRLVTKKVHRLVAECFIENHKNKPQVNHKNGIKFDNHYLNLEWVTNSENQIHAVKNKLIKHSEGDSHHKVKVSNEKLISIFSELKSGVPKRELARKYNVDRSIFRRKVLNEINC